MINHVRTLIMNRKRDGHTLTEPGEEFIDANYVPRVRNPTLRLADKLLFGSNPDRLYMNYRMQQLMQLMHSTPLADDILVDDPRITYLPFKRDLFTTPFGTTLSKIAGPDQVVHISGTFSANNSSGLARQRWTVEVTATEIIVNKRLGVPSRTTYSVPSYGYSSSESVATEPPASASSETGQAGWGSILGWWLGGLFAPGGAASSSESSSPDPTPDGPSIPTTAPPSSRILLPGSDLYLYLHDAPAGYMLNVETAARPVFDVLGLLNGLSDGLGEHGLQELFPITAESPVSTWRRIWATHDTVPMRLAALLLSLAYRTAQMPQEVQRG